MNVQDAAFNTAHDHEPGGAKGLGERMGKASLSDEVNPNCRGAKLGLLDAVKMQRLAMDYRILYAMAAELDHMPPLPMVAMPGASPTSAAAVALVAQDFAQLMQELAKDMADGDITDNELQRIKKRWGDMVAHVQQLMQQLAAANEATRSRRPRRE